METVFETIRTVLFILIIVLIIWRIVVINFVMSRTQNYESSKFNLQDKVVFFAIILFVVMNIVNVATNRYFSPHTFFENIKDFVTNNQLPEEAKEGGVAEEYVPREKASESTPITEEKPKEASAPSQPSIFSTSKGWALKSTKIMVSNYNADNKYEYYVSTKSDTPSDGKWISMDNSEATIDKEGTNYVFVKAVNNGKESNLSSPLEIKVDKEVPTAPAITGGSGLFTTDSRTIKIKTPSLARSGIKLYEYYVSTKSNALLGGIWRTLDNNEVKITNKGSFYVFVRSVSNVGLYSPVSAFERINIKDEETQTPVPDPTPTNPTPTNPTPTLPKPAKPVLGKKYNGWIAIDNIITVDTTLAGNVAVDHYEYYISTSKTELKNGVWTKMSGNSFKYKKDGQYFAFVRALGKNGVLSDLSNPLELWYDLVKPTAPTITGGSSTSAASRTISVSKHSYAKANINAYEYYISTSPTTPTGGSWIEITGSSVNITTKGTHYIFFRGISWSWLISDPSNSQQVVIGVNQNPAPTPTPTPTPTPSPTTGTWNAKTLGKALIYTGDSRTKILSGSVKDGNITFFAEDLTGYEYQVGYAKTQIEKILAKDPNKVVVFASGVNDMENIDKYVAYYKQMNTKWPKTKFYYLSINPIDYSICPYKIQQTLVDMFNARLKKEFPTRYIDMYNRLKDQLKGNTQDGLHYTYEFSGKVNDMIVEYLVNDLNGNASVQPTNPTPTTPTTGSLNVTSYGANGSDASDDTQPFKKALETGKKVYVPAGTYHLKWKSPEGYIPNTADAYSKGFKKDENINVNTLVGKIYGPGLIIVDNWEKNYPNNRNPYYDNAYGRFYADDVNDDLWMSMNLSNEASSINLKGYQQKWNGIMGKRAIGSYENYSDGRSAQNRILNTWGQIMLRMDGSLPATSQSVNIYIGAMGLLGYNEYTKQWDVLLNGIGGVYKNGGLWSYDFSTNAAEDPGPEAIINNFNRVTIPSSKFKALCYHFWTQNKVTIADENKYKWFIAFYDSYTDSDFAANNLVGLPGSDIRTTLSSGSVPGYMSGRYQKLTKYVRRNYTHNMLYDKYKQIVPSKTAIDKIIDMSHYGKIMITN